MNVHQKLLANKLQADGFVCSCRRRDSGLVVEGGEAQAPSSICPWLSEEGAGISRPIRGSPIWRSALRSIHGRAISKLLEVPRPDRE
jgi:hypothetical protein